MSIKEPKRQQLESVTEDFNWKIFLYAVVLAIIIDILITFILKSTNYSLFCI
jgi:hypothetical protein